MRVRRPGLIGVMALALSMSVPETLAMMLDQPIDSDCTWNSIKLYGKVQVVTSFPDIKVQVEESFPDLNVEFVSSFADDCGEWQKVDSFPDFKIQYVDSFPDIKIREVTSFPGLP